MLRFRLKLLSTLRHFNACKRNRTTTCEKEISNEFNIQISELSNGMKVATEETDLPFACVSLFVLSGSRFENRNFNGLSHFIEHMAFKGFYSMSKCELETTIEKMGAKLTAHTTREYQYFSAICPAKHAFHVATILNKIAFDLEFPYCDAQAEKEKMLLEAIDNDNNPKAVVFDYLHQTAFQGTTLGQSVIGPTRNLENIEANSAVCFIKENFHPERLVLAASGGVSHNDIKTLTENLFRSQTPRDLQISDGPQRYTGSQINYRDDTMPFAHVAIAVEVPGITSSEYLPLLIASYIIGSWDKTQGGNLRHASPLACAAAVSNLCVKFESFYIAYRDVGLWGIYYVSERDDVDEMLLNVQDGWMNLCTTTVYSDVQRAANLLKLDLAKNIEGTVNSCLNIGKQVLYTSTMKPLSKIYDEISQISPSTIKTVAYNYIYDKCPAVASIGPTEVLSDYARIRAGMYWLRV